MQELGLSAQQLILLSAAVNAFIGFLLGLIPLLIGISKKQKKLGTWGLIACTVTGTLIGILSLIVVAVFIVLILKAAKKDSAQSAGAATEENNS